MGRIHDKLTADVPHTHGTYRTGKRNVRNGKRSRGTINAEDIRIIFSISAQQKTNNLCVIKVPFWKKGAERSISHPRGQRFLLSRTPLPFKISPREFSCCGRLFTVIHGKRKKVLALLKSCRGNRGGKNDGFPAADGNSTVGKLCHFPSLDGNRSLSYLTSYRVQIFLTSYFRSWSFPLA